MNDPGKLGAPRLVVADKTLVHVGGDALTTFIQIGREEIPVSSQPSPMIQPWYPS